MCQGVPAPTVLDRRPRGGSVPGDGLAEEFRGCTPLHGTLDPLGSSSWLRSQVGGGPKVIAVTLDREEGDLPSRHDGAFVGTGGVSLVDADPETVFPEAKRIAALST